MKNCELSSKGGLKAYLVCGRCFKNHFLNIKESDGKNT